MRQQLQETKKEIFSRNSDGALGSFCWIPVAYTP